MSEKMAAGEIEWLYPDLLSEEGLVFLLKQHFIRHVKGQLESLQKEVLVELYNRYILPLPQRKYRNNRGGLEMTRKQILMDKKLKRKTLNDGGDQSRAKTGKADGPSSGLVNHFTVATSRLKPPPSLVNCEKKVLKLHSSPHVKGTAPESDGIVIKAWNKKVDGNAAEINSSETKTNSTVQADKFSQPKKRSHSSCENENSTEELPKEDTSPSPAKKTIAKITWP